MIHLRHDYEAHGQGHVFRFFDELTPGQQEALTRQAAAIDPGEVARLFETLVRHPGGGNESIADGLSPADFIPLPAHGGDEVRWAEAEAVGEAALRAGRVAAFTVAGGQGTRLGFEGPKGTFPVTPVRNAPAVSGLCGKDRRRGYPLREARAVVHHDFDDQPR
jgi:UDP-N-acetylglucosamine/UDP-N-acetylgalactosamine diphosphorylase